MQRTTSAVSGTLGILLVFAAVLLGYLTRSVFNEGAFSSRVAASLENPRFANYAAEQITDAVIKAKPDLIGLRPVLVGVARNVIMSSPFRAAVRRSARILHHAVMTGTAQELVLDVKDVGVLYESMAATQPGLAKKIPPQVSAALGKLASLPGGERAAQLVRLAHRMRTLTLVFLVFGIVLIAVSVWLASQRRRALLRVGFALAALGLLLAIVARFGGFGLGLFAHQAENSAAIAGLAGAFLAGLLTWAVGLGFAGLVLAAASASFLERVTLKRYAGRALAWAVGPQPLMRLRLLRGVLGAALGASLLFWPSRALAVLGLVAGGVVAFAGLREAFYAALHLLPELEPSAARAAATRGESRRRIPARAIALVGGIAAALVFGVVWVVLRSDATPGGPQDVLACNGSPLLCDKRLDQVVFPTTHNSMSGANVDGWMFPNQSADMEQQLAAGIRGFLIDAHYAAPVGDRVRTELDSTGASMAKYAAVVGPEGMEAALRIRARMQGEETGERDVYMCHGFCELGALKLEPILKDMRDFLVENPGEVLVIVIQDEGVLPSDIARCFEESGLIDFVYKGPARPPWPTLREMVAADQRVLVMAENDTTGVSWYHPAFAIMQETPYTFHTPAEFSNQPNRGGTGGSLALMNHWIETTPMPKPSNAAIVNAKDALLTRIRDFRKTRGRLPNLVAVDFYGTGDLIEVCRELNEAPDAALATTAPGARSKH
jgi:hypothetical protein